MTVAAFTESQLFDGTVTVRSSVRYDATDSDGSLLGELQVSRDRPPTVTNDVSRSVRRNLDNVLLLPRPTGDDAPLRLYAEEFDALTMRVRPFWVYETGGAPVEDPLGVFILSDDQEHVASSGNPRECSGDDLGLILDQDLAASVGFAQGTNVAEALIERADALRLTDRSIDTTTATLSAPRGWTPGRDRELTVMEDLCAVAAFLPPYFDNLGRLICRAAPDLAAVPVTFDLDVLPVLADPPPIRPASLAASPNRYVAVDTASTTGALVGIFDVPAEAPNSYERRGFHIVHTISVPGLADQAAADAAAAAAYATDLRSFGWLLCNTPPDPRHDTFDIIGFDGTKYVERRWSLELRPGAVMSHDCASTYTDAGT